MLTLSTIFFPEFYLQFLNYQCKKKFFSDLKHYYWDEPLLFKRGAEGIFQRCVPE